MLLCKKGNNTLEDKDDNKPEFLEQIILHGCFSWYQKDVCLFVPNDLQLPLSHMPLEASRGEAGNPIT